MRNLPVREDVEVHRLMGFLHSDWVQAPKPMTMMRDGNANIGFQHRAYRDMETKKEKRIKKGKSLEWI
jgi:hypothetical protein